MDSLYKEDVEYCNLDPGVLALMKELPEDASVSQIHGRIAMIKLQQSTILGHSKYAAQMLDQAIEEGSKDKTAHSLLQERMDELQDRVARSKRQENRRLQEEEEASTNTTPKEEADSNKEQTQEKTVEKDVDPLEHERLKKELEAQISRGDSLEDLLESHLTREIKDIKDEEEVIRSLEVRLMARIDLVEKAIQKLPQDRGNKLRDKLGATRHNSNIKSAQAYNCIACDDQKAVLAVIPCGHLCLCDKCLKTVEQKPDVNKQCPVCRAHLLSTLRIYTTR